MQIRTFSAHSTAAVLAKIKEELGPDAVILDTGEEDGMITMTAALERAPLRQTDMMPEDFSSTAPLFPAPPGEEDSLFAGVEPSVTYSPRGRMNSRPDEGDRVSVSKADTVVSSAARQDIPSRKHPHARREYARGAEHSRGGSGSFATGYEGIPGLGSSPYGAPNGWQEEWSSIKNHLLALMKPALQLDRLPPRQRLAIEFLQKEGMEDEAVLALFKELQQSDPSESILSPLSRMVPVRPWSREHWPQRIQLVAGPFGAGKTSVSIRLALCMRRSSPSLSICMVNADATRGNGRLLLRHYCDLSDMSYKEAGSTLELVGALNEALREGYDLILVDLPGISRGRFLTTLVSDSGLARLSTGGAGDIAVHLAVPPHFGSLQMRGVLERYRCPHAGSIVWTKLDEAEHYGQIINAAVSSGLPVSALSYGPGLGNSLVAAKGNMLWRLLFKKELPTGP